MTKSEKAIALFSNGFNCSQSVFTAFSEEFDMAEDDCLKISCAFGGGMGRNQHTCGAVTGALMALGLKFGKANGDDNAKKVNTYTKTTEFFEEFIRQNGSVNCRELLEGLNMNDPADSKRIEELHLFETTCVKCVKDAVEIAENIIQRG